VAIKWQDDAPPNLVKLAVGRCMIAVMDDVGRWRELGSAELRNARGTGHGKSGTPLVDAAVARLTVGLVLPAVIFLVETHEQRTAPGAAKPQIVARPPTPGLRAGVIVSHESFGEGLVEEVSGEGNKMVATVNFGEAGVKRLLVRYAPLTIAST